MINMNKQKGYLLVLAVAIVTLIGFVGVAISYLFSGGMRTGADHYKSVQAFYLAESGLEAATNKLLDPITTSSGFTNRIACQSLALSDVSLGAGVYNVPSTAAPTYITSPTTLNGTVNTSLSANATTIPVASTTGYPTSGRIMIDRELISYTAVDATDFLNATRGIDSTTATTHTNPRTGPTVSGAPVGLYQCSLTSQGGVPNLTTPTSPGDPWGKRTVNDKIQLQEAWVVGANSGGNYGIAHWNGTGNASPPGGTEVTWSNLPTTAGANTLSEVSMLSYADGWAVGTAAAGTFLHWNGSTWSAPAIAPAPAVAYNGVYCNASNDCWAVGVMSGGVPAISHWNGNAWTAASQSGGTNAALQSVHCDSATDCWAVGARNGGNKIFYQSSGGAWTGFNQAAFANGTFPFNGVFCNSPTDCWAVGQTNAFAHLTSGTTWTVVTPAGIPNTVYNGVFCNSSTDCWAVGNVNGGQDLILHGTGSPLTWARVSAPTTGTAALQAVACATPQDCWAVGAAKAFVHYDGTNWNNIPVAAGIPNVQFNSISIISPHGRPQSAWDES